MVRYSKETLVDTQLAAAGVDAAKSDAQRLKAESRERQLHQENDGLLAENDRLRQERDELRLMLRAAEQAARDIQEQNRRLRALVGEGEVDLLTGALKTATGLNFPSLGDKNRPSA